MGISIASFSLSSGLLVSIPYQGEWHRSIDQSRDDDTIPLLLVLLQQFLDHFVDGGDLGVGKVTAANDPLHLQRTTARFRESAQFAVVIHGDDEIPGAKLFLQ